VCVPDRAMSAVRRGKSQSFRVCCCCKLNEACWRGNQEQNKTFCVLVVRSFRGKASALPERRSRIISTSYS
jgi:hypothetical protein